LSHTFHSGQNKSRKRRKNFFCLYGVLPNQLGKQKKLTPLVLVAEIRITTKYHNWGCNSDRLTQYDPLLSALQKVIFSSGFKYFFILAVIFCILQD
jgi:hypothetical protein